MEIREEDREDDEAGDEVKGKQSMLKLFLMAREEEHGEMSSWTPKSLSPPLSKPTVADDE